METDKPDIGEMARQISQDPELFPPRSFMPLALIANVEPELLDKAIDRAKQGMVELELAESGQGVANAEAAYELHLDKVGDYLEQRNAWNRLEMARAKQAEAPNFKDEIEADYGLAKGVQFNQNKLTRAKRWLTTLACTAVIGGGGWAVADKTYENDTPNDNISSVLVKGVTGVIGLMCGLAIADERKGKQAQRKARQTMYGSD